MIALRRRDDGVTLVELIIASFLLVGVAASAGWILVASLNGGKNVSGSGTASSQAQILADSIAGGVRSATDVTLTDLPASPTGPTAAHGQLLRAMQGVFDETGAAISWSCRAWAITDDGRAYTMRSATHIPDPASQSQSDFAAAGWTLLGSGLESHPVTGDYILSKDSSSVGVSARGDGGGGSPALVVTSVTVQPLTAAQTSGAPSC